MDQRPCADGLRPAVEQTPYPQNESRRVHIAPQWPVWPALLNWHQLRTAGPWKWERAAMQRQLPPLVAPRRIIRTSRDQLLGGSSSRSRDRTPRGIIKPKPRSTPRCSQRRRITTPATCPPPLKGRGTDPCTRARRVRLGHRGPGMTQALGQARRLGVLSPGYHHRNRR